MEIFNIYNTYRILDADNKMVFTDSEYIRIISNMLASMFDISGFNTSDKTFLLKSIFFNGICYLEENENEKLMIPCHYYGLPNKYDVFPTRIIGTKVINDDTIYINDDINNLKGDVIYIFPDRLFTNIIDSYATKLTDIDISLNNNLIYSRIAPVTVIDNDNTQIQYDIIIDKMIKGDIKNTIKAPKNPLTQKQNTIETIDISNGDYAEKIQYLNMYYSQVISRLCSLFGIDYNFISKSANITNDELHNSEQLSAIYPYIMLNCLTDSFENYYNKTGIKHTIKFSKPFEHLNTIEDYDQQNNIEEDNNNDITI